MSVLCLLEADGTAVAPGSLRALSFAAAAAADHDVTAVLVGPGGETVASDEAIGAELTGRGATALCLVAADRLGGYAPVAWARALQQLAAGDDVTVVVAAATDRGGEVMAHLGAMTGLPVAANCVSAAPSAAGHWQLVRQRWAGSVLENALLEAPLALLTVAADANAADPREANPREADPREADPREADRGPAGPESAETALPVRRFTARLDDADVLVTAVESAAEAGGTSLATARVVVGGGRGVGGPDGFAPLEELASLLGGTVGVSRVVTSQGWRPHRQQVGQTGTKISPELYLACGISGAIQHMAGCLGARHIVAINTDPAAPIMSRADYAVIGDLAEIIPALVAAIRDPQSSPARMDGS
jgi:electron transfer flavoprotein alpha subunit